MGSRKDQRPQGFAVLDPRWGASNLRVNSGALGDSDYTEQGPRPGHFLAADDRSRALLEMSNAQEVGAEFRAVQGGRAERGAASFAYRLTSETDDISFRGWHAPNFPSHWSAVFWSDATSRVHLDVDTFPASQEPLVLMSGRVSRWSNATQSWGAEVVVDITGANQANALAIRPDTERALVFQVTGSAASVSVLTSISDDGGATWLDAFEIEVDLGAISGTLDDQCTAAIIEDEVLLMVRNTAGEWIQLASSDQGASWALVATIASTFGRGLHVFALPFGGFGMTWIDDVDFDISYTTLPSAYTTVTTTPKIDVFVTAFSVQNHRCFGWADPDGTIWAGWTTREQTHLAFSADGGLTWSDLDWGLWSPDTDDTHLEALTAAPCQGGLILVHNWVAKVGNEGGSVGAWFTGGWSQFETRQAYPPDLGVVPQLQRRISFGDVDGSARVEFAHTWLPLDLPTDYDPSPPGPAAPVYTLAGATAGVLVSPGAMEIASVGSAGRYDRDLSAVAVNYLQDSIYCLAEFQVLSGGSGTVTEAGIALRIADGTDDIELRINANATGFRVRDENGAVDKATVTIDMTAGVVIMILFKTGTVDFTEVWYRPRGFKPEWTRIEAGTFVSDTATPNADPIISWGNPVSGTATTRWFQFHAIYNDTTGGQSLHSGTAQPLGLRGRWLSTQGLPVPTLATTTKMARAAVTRGPVSRDEVHMSDPAHDFPIEALFPRTGPSPTQRWRSADASNTRIAIDLERDSRLDGSWAYALALVGTNLDLVELEGWDGAAWVTLGQYVGATGFTGLTYSLTGDVIRPNTATTADAERFLQANEFRGGYAILDPTGTPKVRRIAYHNAGSWNRTDTAHPHIRLEGIDGTEPAGSTCRLVAPGGVLFVHLAGATGDHYERFSINIKATSNPTQDGHYEIGALHFAAVTAIGQQWGRGWSRALLPNISSRTDTAGTTRRKQEGDNARRWVMSWQDPHDLTLMRAGLDLDYISADAGTVPMAAVGDVALQLEGVLDAAQGGAVPCLGLAFVPASTNTTITDRTLWIYGLLTGTIQANNVLGSEGSSEVFRVESITINELVG